jgi:hypothetical protein
VGDEDGPDGRRIVEPVARRSGFVHEGAA